MRGSTNITLQFSGKRLLRRVRRYSPRRCRRPRLTKAEIAAGELRIEPGYLAIRDLIRRASESLWAIGFLSRPSSPAGSRVPLELVTRAAELELELRDESGALMWTDFVNIVERPDAEDAPVVFARVRLAPAARAAVVGPR